MCSLCHVNFKAIHLYRVKDLTTINLLVYPDYKFPAASATCSTVIILRVPDLILHEHK